MAKIAPSVTRLWFNINPANRTNYLDISLAASAANRRFYRQSTTWAVAGFSLVTQSDTIGEVEISKIPDTWAAKNAHTKSKSLWFKSQDQVLDEQPSIRAKYADFKVNLDEDMLSASIQDASANPVGDGDIMLPVDRNNFTAKYGEWVYSTLQLPNDGGSVAPTEVQFHMVGANVISPSSVGMIHGYGLARSRPQLIEPNTPTDGGWMNDVFDVADNLDEIRLDVTDNNDVPPYRVGDDTSADEFYPGGENNQPSAALHSINFVTGTTVGGKTHMEGGMFHCGLVRFDYNMTNAAGGAVTDTNMWLAVDLVPGNYKGYLTEVY
jgi:hypothetical protein